ncbi:MAG: type II secretion system F family protein [Syntrophomonadaceae bacterium]|mgnify:FL=1|nr:type II secretion system F family protein [Syntrophomonadaceae bacterium]
METILLLMVMGFAFSICMAIILRIKRERLLVLNRLEEAIFAEEEVSDHPILANPLRVRMADLILPRLRKISNRMISNNRKEVYEHRLAQAGHPWRMNAGSYIIGKYIFILLLLIFGIISRNTTIFLILVIIGLFMPDLFLKSNEKKRKELMVKSLPDVLDLISVSVEAGLGFDAALQKVVEKTSGPLTEEFEQTLNEINMGKPRREALRDMANRIQVDDISTFLGSIIQADQLGVSMTNVLRIQSRQVRENRRMKAEEAAQKAPIKILIPLVVFIFPTLLVVLLGPAILSLIDNL